MWYLQIGVWSGIVVLLLGIFCVLLITAICAYTFVKDLNTRDFIFKLIDTYLGKQVRKSLCIWSVGEVYGFALGFGVVGFLAMTVFWLPAIIFVIIMAVLLYVRSKERQK